MYTVLKYTALCCAVLYCTVLYCTVLYCAFCYLVVSLILSNSSIQHIPLSESTSAPARNKCTVINDEIIIKNRNRTNLRLISSNFKTDSADSCSHQYNDYLPYLIALSFPHTFPPFLPLCLPPLPFPSLSLSVSNCLSLPLSLPLSISLSLSTSISIPISISRPAFVLNT